MGALQKIRNRAGLLVAALGLALLAFILGDLFNSGGAWVNKFKDKAFTVDGDVVSTGTYQDRVSQFEDFQKFVSGQSSIDDNLRSQISQFVYEQMVKEKILDEQSERLGLTVTKEELNDMVYGQNISPVLLQSPIFADPNTRQFSREGLMQFLTYIQTDINTVPDEQKVQLMTFKQQWLVIENMMKYYRLEEKYNHLLMAAMLTNDVDAKAEYEGSKKTANIAYVINRYSTISDSSITVSDKEIEKLYNERKNNFKLRTDLRKVSYISRDVAPSESDFKAVETQMNTVYEKMLTTTNPALLVADYSEVPYRDVFFSESVLSPEEKGFVQTANIGDVRGPLKDNDIFSIYKLVDKTLAPDSVKLRMILVPEGTDAAVARLKADSIYNVIKGGKDFATVAIELNPQSKGGEVGWATEPMLANAGENFIKACFGAQKGELLKLNNNNTIQIVKVEEITRSVPKYKIALVQTKVAVSDKTLHDIDTELNNFVTGLGDTKSFNKVASEKGFNVMPDMQIDPSSIGLPQINGSRQIIHWAFNEKVGSIKKFDLTEKRVVAVITEETKAGYYPVKEVSDYLKAEIIKDKKAEKMIAEMKSKNLTSLDAYAQSLGSKVDTANFVKFTTPNITSGGLGREPVFNVYSEYADVNKLQGPVKGNNGVFVLSVLNRTEDATEYNPVQIKQSLDQMLMYRFNSNALFDVLKEKLDVQDNRVKFF